MKVTVDTENKKILLHEEVNIGELESFLEIIEDDDVDNWSIDFYKISPPYEPFLPNIDYPKPYKEIDDSGTASPDWRWRPNTITVCAGDSLNDLLREIGIMHS